VEPLFSLTVTLQSAASHDSEEVAFTTPDPPISPRERMRVARTFIVPEDLGTPPGGWRFAPRRTSNTAGLDTVYTAVLNMIERPERAGAGGAGETDWYAHEPSSGTSATGRRHLSDATACRSDRCSSFHAKRSAS